MRTEVTSTQLANLPTPLGRSYENLLVTVPGLSPPSNQHSVAVNPARGLTFSAMGTTRNSNSVRIEGAIANSPWLPHVTAYVPALEAIDTVSVVTGSFDADLGLSGGSAVNLQMKSGSNVLHGSAFEYHSDNALKAKPYFLPLGQRKPKAINNQFGGTVGGPHPKRQAVLFRQLRRHSRPSVRLADSDGSHGRHPRGRYVRVRQSDSRPAVRGATDDRTPFPNKLVPAAQIDPIVTRILADLPQANLSGLSNNFYAAGPYPLTRNKLDTKGNWNATNKLTFTGRFGWLKYDLANPPSFGKLVGPQCQRLGR